MKKHYVIIYVLFLLFAGDAFGQKVIGYVPS